MKRSGRENHIDARRTSGYRPYDALGARMDRTKRCTLTWAFCGPEEIRTPDLTRARRAKAIYGGLQRRTFMTIHAGLGVISGYGSLHPFAPTSSGDVEGAL